MQRSKATPVQLVGLSILGSLIAASAFLVISAGSHYRHDGNGGFLLANLIAMLAFLCGGWYLSIWAQLELSNGIQLDRWTEEQLHPVRIFSESWIAKGTPIALAVIGIALFLHHSGSIGFWVCFVLSNGLMALRHSLAAPNDSQSTSWLESSAPLQSEHWGE
jgi:hypothetical protein